MESGDLTVRVGAEDTSGFCLDILNQAYERDRFTDEWFEWKHDSGPWGPSQRVVCTDDNGPLGVVFALPWMFHAGGSDIRGARFVDGGTTPAARRRGVFRRMIAAVLERWEHEKTTGLLLATATPAAQASHVKNGASALAPIPYRLGWAVPRTARLTRGNEVIDTLTNGDARIRTAWTPDALRWRTDRRSGHHYDAASLSESDGPNGIVYRTTAVRGIRLLVPLVTWGSTRERGTVLAATLRSERCVATLAPAGPGTEAPPCRWTLRRGEVLACTWDRRPKGAEPTTSDVASWAFAGADVEGVI